MDDTKNALVYTTDTVVKEGNTDTVDKKRKTRPNVVKEYITPPISEKRKIDTFNKTGKSQASNKTVDTPRSNKTDKVKVIYKSRSTQRTDTEKTVNKSGSIPRTSFYNKITRIKPPSEIDIHMDNLSGSFLSGQGEILSSVTPDILCINRSNKK